MHYGLRLPAATPCSGGSLCIDWCRERACCNSERRNRISCFLSTASSEAATSQAEAEAEAKGQPKRGEV